MQNTAQNTAPKYPATPKQVALIQTLQAERGMAVIPAEDYAAAGTTKKQASELISAIMAIPKPQVAAPQAPKPTLVEMAAKITGSAIPVEAPVVTSAQPEEEDDLESQPAIMLAFDHAECAALRSAVSVCIGETDGSEMDHALYAKLDAFLKAGAPVKPQVKPGNLTLSNASQFVPAGHYAVTGADGTTDFYRVEYGKAGSQWDGFLFLSQQLSDDYVPVKAGPVKLAVLVKIVADTPLAAAQRYGHELGVCGICHKTLTDPQSIADGIGPVCKSKLGA